MKNGFTILEMVVSIAIFAMMTALLLAKYGNFNQGVILTNLAYDVALSLRNAQSYGLNVKSATRSDNYFKYKYGIHFFDPAGPLNKRYVFFFDENNDGQYDSGTEDISVTNIKKDSIISAFCVGNGNACSISTGPSSILTSLDIFFKRPDPNAIMKVLYTYYNYAEITLKASDGTIKKVIVRGNGQITVTD